ncbi:hypothetical protein [Phyllobacterium leguminum]|uniref:Uncharacterized protein n=1 Tax=Phyllobacterium leguminum TaxID=314237 RepID=A0A318SY06_9HYPH|nr:hypothetical protein [Phyllobacterium leguminum]PYE86932.1 hypothetical protein C7477_11870 [Phyllobacterium leguminum]
MHPHETHRRDALSALIRAQREAEADIHQATCHKRLPDDVVASLTGRGMSEMCPGDYLVSEDFSMTITRRRKRFSFWRRAVRKFPASF